ncbi:MAG: hypothetical protein WA936_14580 [Erythrobacter sp.]|uniref:Nmad3 family putative nucleotide modification protein n=1 Tax=Erythrobacter sp. TaxID=1042 RepID=UPI003C758F8D
MRIIFSRKGFDSVAGGGPSPIVPSDEGPGRPVSLPIPAYGELSRTTYADLALGDEAERASRGKVARGDWCHHDPMFLDDGTAILGQCGSAQGHLAKQRVGLGDVFVFFGLFEGAGEARHHRIFGYLEVAEVVPLKGASDAVVERFERLGHPHAFGFHGTNDTLYTGPGEVARRATPGLRLTAPEGPVSLWQRPNWLRRGEISYFPDKDANWPAPDRMYRVGNGQEFVTDIGERAEPREWLAQVIAQIRAS